MSLLDRLFPSQTAPAPQPGQQPNIPLQAQAAPTPLTPSPEPPKDPLSEFSGLWENTPEELAAQDTSLNFNITPEQLATISDKLDFSSVVTPELRQRIAAGGEDAMAASMEMQNLVARAVYQQNALATTKLVEAAHARSQATIGAQIDQRFKAMGLAENTAINNPALTNPAVAPIVKNVQQQILQKFPQATSQEIQAKTNEYLNELGKALNPAVAKQAAAPQVRGVIPQQQETDWASYFSS
jgi:hypothetical protein